MIQGFGVREKVQHSQLYRAQYIRTQVHVWATLTSGLVEEKLWVSILALQPSSLPTEVSQSRLAISSGAVSDLMSKPARVRCHQRCPWAPGTSTGLADLYSLGLQDSRVLWISSWGQSWMP